MECGGSHLVAHARLPDAFRWRVFPEPDARHRGKAIRVFVLTDSLINGRLWRKSDRPSAYGLRSRFNHVTESAFVGNGKGRQQAMANHP